MIEKFNLNKIDLSLIFGLFIGFLVSVITGDQTIWFLFVLFWVFYFFINIQLKYRKDEVLPYGLEKIGEMYGRGPAVFFMSGVCCFMVFILWFSF